MSDDWAKKYVATRKREYEERRQKEEDERKKRGLAEAFGPDKFRRIQARIAQDVEVLKEAPAFQSMAVDLSIAHELTVAVVGSAPARLQLAFVDLRFIRYAYNFVDTAGTRTLQVNINPQRKLCISSDLDGIITVHEDEQGKVFSDDADISEFLLAPLLDYVTR